MPSLIALLALSTFASAANPGDVLINELVPDPSGADAGNEWAELHNTTDVDIDLGGWTLERAKTTWGTQVTFPTGTLLPAGGYLLVAEELTPPGPGVYLVPNKSTAIGGLDLGNATTNADGVRLTDGTNVIDTVIYGPDNTPDQLFDDGGAPATSLAATPPADRSLARSPDGADTNLCGADFTDSVPTPGAPNPRPPQCVPSIDDVRLNEVFVNPVGADGTVLEEWVELSTSATTPVDLEGWALERASKPSTWETVVRFDPGTAMTGYFVIGETNTAADLVLTVPMSLYAGTGGDSVRLVDCAGTVVDTLVYGGANTDLFAEDDASVPADGAPKPAEGEAVARVQDGVDTNVCAVDWHIPASATPGAANPVPQLCVPSAGTLRLNELVANPAGVDATAQAEYVELFNSGVDPVELSGWELQTTTALTWTTRVRFAEGQLVPGSDWWVVSEANVVGADLVVPLLDLPSGSGGDGVRLVDCTGAVVDTVVYGDSNDDGVLDDSGAPATSWAAKPGDDQVLARLADGADTDLSGDDWWVASGSTPGAANPLPPQCDAAQTGLVINELVVNPAGSDTTALTEYVELYNGGANALDLAGWSVQVATSAASWSTRLTLPTLTLNPGEFALLGEPNVLNATLTTDRLDLPSGAGGDGVRLVDCAGAVVDTVVYGGLNDDGVIDDSGATALSVAPKPGDDQALARRADGVDTNLSGDDFWLAPTQSGGAPNPLAPVCVPNTGPGVVINELLPDPYGSDATAQAEWVELYNNTDAAIDLAGWTLETATSGASFSIRASLPDGALIPAKSWLLLGEALVPGADLVVGPLSLPSGLGGDALRLVDCSGAVIDTVVYGDTNDDGLLDDTGALATTWAPKPATDCSVARQLDGVDTDDSGADLYALCSPTPGVANPPPPVCEPNPGAIVINELLANPAGSDSAAMAEWVELFSGATSDLRLDGWQIATASSSDGYTVRATFPPETTLRAGGLLVIGEPNAAVADVRAEKLFLGSGSHGDAVRLLDCRGDAVDTVAYGQDNEDGVVDDLGSAATSLAAAPTDDQSIARLENGVDSDLSGVDFTTSDSPTPGALNPLILCVPSNGSVVLNEVLPDPGGADGEAHAEWVEVYNRGDSDVAIDGWSFQFASRPGSGQTINMPSDVIVPAHGFLVLGDVEVPEANVVAALAIPNGSGGDSVRLSDCTGALVDVLVFGANNDDLNTDETGAVASPSPQPGSDMSLARPADGVDTNQASDWVPDRTPTPGASNVPPIVVDTGEEPRGCGQRAPDGSAPDGGGCSAAQVPTERGLLGLALALSLLRRRA